jgi:hypothetical protein
MKPTAKVGWQGKNSIKTRFFILAINYALVNLTPLALPLMLYESVN